MQTKNPPRSIIDKSLYKIQQERYLVEEKEMSLKIKSENVEYQKVERIIR